MGTPFSPILMPCGLEAVGTTEKTDYWCVKEVRVDSGVAHAYREESEEAGGAEESAGV